MFSPLIIRPAMDPRLRLRTVTQPAPEPVSLSEAKLWLRLDQATEDPIVLALTGAARQLVERETRRAIGVQTLRLTLSWFPPGGVIELPRPPLRSVTSVRYYDGANALQTLSSSAYGVSAGGSTPGILSLLPGQVFPATADREDAVMVDYEAGHADDGEPTPAPLTAAMRLALGYLYEQRGQPAGPGSGDMPAAFGMLCAPYAVTAL